MPTATLVRRVGASSYHTSSVVVELVASSSSVGISHNSQEVDNCNGTDASISVASSQSKNKIQRHKEKTVAKKSQPDVKPTIMKKKKTKKISLSYAPSRDVRSKLRREEFASLMVRSKEETMQLCGMYQSIDEGRSMLDAWSKIGGEAMQSQGM